MVDSLQALSLAGLGFFLLKGQWRAATIVVFLGAAGKGTTLPLAAAFSGGWTLWCISKRRWHLRAAFSWLVLVAVATAGTEVMPILLGRFSSLLELKDEMVEASSLREVLVSFGTSLVQWNLWLTVGWMIPPAWLVARTLDAAWWAASLVCGATILVLGAFNLGGPNVARPLIAALGPILTLGTAIWIDERLGDEPNRPCPA